MTEPTDALLPCPFCGEAAKHSFNSLYGDMSMASCKSCGATAYAPKWNRRAVLAKWGTPAPVEVALSDDLRDRLVAISEAVADQDDRAAQAMLREILKAPQPSPTAQTDSVPAIQGEMNVQLDIDSNHSAPGQQRDVDRSLALGQPVGNGQDQAAGRPSAQGDKLLTVAERNIRSFLRSATFKSESDREAALNCVDVLWAAARYRRLREEAHPDSEVSGVAVSETDFNDWDNKFTRHYSGE